MNFSADLIRRAAGSTRRASWTSAAWHRLTGCAAASGGARSLWRLTRVWREDLGVGRRGRRGRSTRSGSRRNELRLGRRAGATAGASPAGLLPDFSHPDPHGFWVFGAAAAKAREKWLSSSARTRTSWRACCWTPSPISSSASTPRRSRTSPTICDDLCADRQPTSRRAARRGRSSATSTAKPRRPRSRQRCALVKAGEVEFVTKGAASRIQHVIRQVGERAQSRRRSGMSSHSAAVELAAVGLRRAAAPLLEEERDPGRRCTASRMSSHPGRAPSVGARGPDSPPAITQSMPVEVQVRQRAEQRLAGQEPDRGRDVRAGGRSRSTASLVSTETPIHRLSGQSSLSATRARRCARLVSTW